MGSLSVVARMLRILYKVEEYCLERFVAAHLLGGPGSEQLAATDDGHLVAKFLNYLEYVRREKTALPREASSPSMSLSS